MPPLRETWTSSSTWLQNWVVSGAGISIRATLLLAAVMAVVFLTRRWTVPAWRFTAILAAMSGFVVVSLAALLNWRWHVVPTDAIDATLSRLASLDWIRQGIVSAAPWIFSIWLAGALLYAARLALGHASLWRLAAITPTTDNPSLLDRVERLRRQMGLTRPIAVHVSSRRMVPMTWGIFRTHLLIPETILTWPVHQVEAIILHELAHVRRADCFWQGCVQMVTCLFWFDPMVWLANRRMLNERENACDYLAIGAGAKPSAYAEALIAVTQQQRLERPLLAVAMAGGSRLYRRLAAILEDPHATTTVRKRWIGLWAATILLSAILHPRVAERDLVDAEGSRDHDVQAASDSAKADQQPPAVHDGSKFAAGTIHYDVRRKTIVSDDPSPRWANLKAEVLQTAEFEGVSAPVAVRLDRSINAGTWDVIGKLNSLQKLQLTQVPNDSMRQMQVPPYLRELDFEQVELPNWDQLTCLPMLTRLSLRDTEFSGSAFVGISYLPSLESLQVERSQLRGSLTSSLDHLENLQSVSLAESDVDDASLAMFAQLPNLRRLSLAGAKLSSTGLSQIARSTSIEDLDLTGAEVDQEALAALGAMPNLRSIQLSCIDGPVLRILMGVPNLQEISVQNKSGDVEGLTPCQWRKRIGDIDCPKCFDVPQPSVG